MKMKGLNFALLMAISLLANAQNMVKTVELHHHEFKCSFCHHRQH